MFLKLKPRIPNMIKSIKKIALNSFQTEYLTLKTNFSRAHTSLSIKNENQTDRETEKNYQNNIQCRG